MYTYHASTDLTFLCPRKPRVTVHVADACTLEPVLGMRFRVFGRRLVAPYIPEGEEQAAALALSQARARALQELAKGRVAAIQVSWRGSRGRREGRAGAGRRRRLWRCPFNSLDPLLRLWESLTSRTLLLTSCPCPMPLALSISRILPES